MNEPCLHLRFDLPNSMGLLYVTALMEIFSRAYKVGDRTFFCLTEPDGKSIAAMTAFHKPSEPGMFSFAAVFNLPIFGQLFLTIEKCAAVHDAVMVPNGKEVIRYIFIFPFTGIPFAYKDASVGAVKILWFVCHNGAFGFVVIVNGNICLDVSGIFQNAGKFYAIKIDAAGRKSTAADQDFLHICQTGIGLGVCIKIWDTISKSALGS